MSAPPESTEQRELSLVGKVEMKFAFADTEAKLEGQLKTYLTPLLLKLASDHQSVRQKVISICQHINTRIQPQSIQLPVKALVEQFKSQDSSMIRHFDMLYIQQGITRLRESDRAELLPVVIRGISKNPSHGSQIFYLLLRLLDSFTLPPRGSKDDVELRTKLDVSDDDVRYLAHYLGKFFLFVPQKGQALNSPGLSSEEYTFFKQQGKDGVWDPAAGGLNLQRSKTLAARLLASGLFNDKERFLPALFASADPAQSISDVGDDMMKRALPATDLEDEFLVKELFDLYFGTEATLRVRAPLRLKILSLLNKSIRSTSFSNNITKLVDDGVAPQRDGEDIIMSNGPFQQNASIGREALKLRAAIFTYINFVARNGDKQSLHTIAQPVINRLRDFVENQGWPKPGNNEDLVSRGYTYEVIGLLAQAGPSTLLVEDEHPTMDLLRWLFDSLGKDSSGNAVTLSIDDSLSSALTAMARINIHGTAAQDVLEDLLIDQMTQSAHLEGARIRSTRYVAVRFANRCLPYSSIKARWVDVLAVGATSDRAEVREEGERGLSPYWYRMLNSVSVDKKSPDLELPTFEETMDEFFIKQTPIPSTEAAVVVQKAKDLHSSSFPIMTAFARRMLVAAVVEVNLDNEWERRLDAMIESDVSARNHMKAHIADTMTDTPELLNVLVLALFQRLDSPAAPVDDKLVEFLALSPEQLIRNHVDQAHGLIPLLRSNNHSRRLTVAHVFGILASHPDSSTLIQPLLEATESWSTAVGAGLNVVHGAVVALGHYYSRCAARGGSRTDMPHYQTFLKTLTQILTTARDDLLREASHIAIGQMCMFGPLTSGDLGLYTSVTFITDKLYEKAKDGNEIAILCLGQVSMILPEDDEELRHIEEQLHKLHEIRQAEAHFTVGEALSYLAAGWQSSALATKLDVAVAPDRDLGQTRTSSLQKLVNRVLKDCSNTKPSLKKAAVMWLLCLVQFCGDLLQDRLSECQAAFRRCLADRDELVQETASRGLGLVYEKGDRKLKDDLVRELVSSFSSDKQQLAGNVSEDTQLFEPGALPTGDGSVSTYKDIMSLAAEVGDSSLVYKFMSMASSNAIWSSRAAFGRFGLSKVLSDSSVDGYLANNPKLYPKLFRYRFDPNGGVQKSMKDIWEALVPDSSATIDKYFDPIMEDLLSSILGKEWRVRQACCGAIADLVQGRPLEKYEKYLEQIWTQCFKVLDDIKESVRAAAASLARTLTGVLTRALEADHSSTKNASAMLKHVLPFLLSSSGMESSAQDVQQFSVVTLLEIIKKANGATIRPFIPELVERLIGLLSSMEHEAVNYVHLNADKYNLTEQKIDDMRLSNVRSSPLMEAIERCLDLLDPDTMKALWPKLGTAMKSAVGLPSKVGSSRVLVSLATRRIALFRSYSDDALKLVERLIIDRNDTVASSYAAAAGYLVRGASDKQVLRLIVFAKKLYFESEGDREGVVPRRSITSGEIIHAFARHATDKFNEFASSILPFVFVAKHDSHEQVKEPFQEAWNEVVSGSRTVQLYLKEIVELCSAHLDSPQWILKHTAARSVADVVNAVSSSEAEMSATTGNAIWPALEKALGGKTWEGKEAVLSAFVKFVEIGKPYYREHEKVRSDMVKIAIREAKRQNAGYRQHSVKALGKVAQARSDIDMSDAIFEVVGSLIEQQADGDAMDVDGGKDQARKAEEIKDAITGGAIETAFAAINPAVSEGSALTSQLARAVHLVAAAKPTTSALLRSTYEGLNSAFDRVHKQGSPPGDLHSNAAVVEDLRTLLFRPVVSVESLRAIRADAVASMLKACPSLKGVFEVDVKALIANEVSSSVRDRFPSP
ncbi:Proteasome component ECM29 [Lecanosticta acicola]|uniref:Proteasome component ECM29 n=1 Tax=Lecanosticta acicola TaxID=111012 RepID=A0AAI8YT61_9PEZI|nr:Proteasome component ECM29 [Lecanosticta acicola]